MEDSETRVGTIFVASGEPAGAACCYDLLFTSSRIIFAKAGKTPSMGTASIAISSAFSVWMLFPTETSKLYFIGWLLYPLICIIGAIIYSSIVRSKALSSLNSHRKEIANKSIEEILSLSSTNYSISNSDIASIHIYQQTLSIITANEIKIFVLLGNNGTYAGKDLIKEYDNTIKHALPDKIDIFNIQLQAKIPPISP
jgi:hypothetical protein